VYYLDAYITQAIPTLSHVLGFTGPIAQKDVDVLLQQGYRRFDSVGKQGIEAEYESRLRGTPGVEIIEVNGNSAVASILFDLSKYVEFHFYLPPCL